MTRISQGSVRKMEDKPRKHCRKWRLQVSVDGRALQKRYNGTYGGAVDALEEWKEELETDSALEGDPTVSEWLAHYVEVRASAGNVAESTVENWKSRFKAVEMHIGGMRMRDVKPSDVERMYAAMRNGETPSGRRSSGTYCASVNAVLHTAFSKAVRDRVIASNPLDDVERPKPDTKERQPLSVEEQAELIAKLDPRHPQHLAIILMVVQGLRRGETLCIRWEDVDFDANVMHVRKSKTKAGIRDVPMVPYVRECLERVRDERTGGYVVGRCGEKMQPHSINRWWQRHAEELGLDGYTPHSLRHTFATRLAEGNVHPRVMQELLGHESIDTSMRIYTHISTSEKENAIFSMTESYKIRTNGTK